VEVLRVQKYNKKPFSANIYKYVHTHVRVYIYFLHLLFPTRTLETKHWTTGPVWNGLSYAFRKFWRFDLQVYKKQNSDMLQCYNAEVATLI